MSGWEDKRKTMQDDVLKAIKEESVPRMREGSCGLNADHGSNRMNSQTWTSDVVV